MELDRRPAVPVVHHLELAPTDRPRARAAGERLERRLLRGDSRRKMKRRIGSSHRVRRFTIGEQPAHRTLTFLQQPADAGDLDEVEPDAHDHEPSPRLTTNRRRRATRVPARATATYTPLRAPLAATSQRTRSDPDRKSVV